MFFWHSHTSAHGVVNFLCNKECSECEHNKLTHATIFFRLILLSASETEIIAMDCFRRAKSKRRFFREISVKAVLQHCFFNHHSSSILLIQRICDTLIPSKKGTYLYVSHTEMHANLENMQLVNDPLSRR